MSIEKKLMRILFSAFGTLSLLASFLALSAIASNAKTVGTKSGFVTTADGVKIHYLEAGMPRLNGQPKVVISQRPMGEADLQFPRVPSILFIPGWTMPAWIWQKQIDYFSKNYRVVAMDPRSQGESTVTSEGLYPAARARDIKAVVDQLHLAPVVLVGWSMAVTELAAYVDQFGTDGIAGFVFVDDNFGGRGPGDADYDLTLLGQVLGDRQKNADAFVRNLCFKKPQPVDYINRVIQACLRTPTSDAVALLVGNMSADYRASSVKIDKPSVFCFADSAYMSAVAQQAIQRSVKGSRLEIFKGAGHALFVDNADQFNSVLEIFLTSLDKSSALSLK